MVVVILWTSSARGSSTSGKCMKSSNWIHAGLNQGDRGLNMILKRPEVTEGEHDRCKNCYLHWYIIKFSIKVECMGTVRDWDIVYRSLKLILLLVRIWIKHEILTLHLKNFSPGIISAFREALGMRQWWTPTVYSWAHKINLIANSCFSNEMPTWSTHNIGQSGLNNTIP
jgi:hypothetical protein